MLLIINIFLLIFNNYLIIEPLTANYFYFNL